MTQSRPEKPPSETRQSIRTCIIAQTMGSPLPQVLINGGILSLFIIALGGSKLAVGSVFTVNYLGQLVRVLAAPHIDVAHPKKFVLRWFTLSAAGGIIVAMSGFSLIGLAVGGLGIGHTVRQMYAAPRSSRSSYMAVFFMANGLVGAITSVLAGAMLDHFPASISLAGLDASPIRLFFVLVSLLVLTSAILLWNLDPVAEKPIRIAVHDFLCLLPPTLTYPLRIVDLYPHVRVDTSQPASEPPEGHC